MIINIKCYILPDSNYDIILGRPDINKYQILDKVALSGDEFSELIKRKRTETDHPVKSHYNRKIPENRSELHSLSTDRKMGTKVPSGSEAKIKTCMECRTAPHKNCTAGCAADKKAKTDNISDFSGRSVRKHELIHWVDIEPILPIEVYVGICDELYTIAQEKISEISEENLKRPDIPRVFRLPNTGSGKAGQRGVAQTCMIASVRGPSNIVGDPTAGTVYEVNQSEDFSDGKIPIMANASENPSKKRIHKSEILDSV